MQTVFELSRRLRFSSISMRLDNAFHATARSGLFGFDPRLAYQSPIPLKADDRLLYQRAIAALVPTKTSLDAAAREYAEAVKQLGGASLETAVAFYLARHPANLQRRTVADVVAEFQEAKTKDGASPAYLRDLKFRLRAFANTFRCAIGDVDEPGLNAWLRSLKCSARTRNNYRGIVTTLIRFAEAQAYLPTGAVDLRKVAKGREVENTVEIFTPSEMAKLLAAAQVDRHELEPGWNRRWASRQGLLPLLILGGFAGMRTAEVCRQRWEDINLERGFIRVTAGKGGTAQRRLISISANCRAWLGLCRHDAETCCDYPRPFEAIQRLEKRAGVPWKHNALRHSYGTYRLAETNDLPRVAIEMGNSPRMILKHYRELATPDEAKTLRPTLKYGRYPRDDRPPWPRQRPVRDPERMEGELGEPRPGSGDGSVRSGGRSGSSRRNCEGKDGRRRSWGSGAGAIR